MKSIIKEIESAVILLFVNTGIVAAVKTIPLEKILTNLVLFATLVYTVIKIINAIKQLREKKSLNGGNNG
jgi:hypothetical protein